LIASPASAATLPSGQRISTVGLLENPDEQFFDVSPADASSTGYGAPQALWPVEALDVNDDGIGWAIQTQSGGDGSIPVLRPADANTGVLGPGVPIVPTDGELDLDECRGLAMLPDGTLIAGCVDYGDGGVMFGYLGYLSTDGSFDENMTFEDEAVLDVRAVAYNPVTGELWAFGPMPGDSDIPVALQFTATTEGFWNVVTTVVTPNIVESADYDRDGQLFGLILVDEDFPHLATIDPAAGTITQDIGIPAAGGEEVSMRSITVWGKPALPATGPAEILPIGLGTALLFLAGAAFIATGRIQRRAQ
jgi:hypothetical protein